MPPPVPVLSIFGVLNLPARPNCSATVVVNGYTVDEPTMLMESRADCACAALPSAQMTPAAREEIMNLRVTVIASGSDARHFIAEKLQKYFKPK
jgi:hypothetical protein